MDLHHLLLAGLPAHSGQPRSRDIVRLPRHVGSVPILLQKSFWGDGQIFPGPLMRFARGDMRDHIVSHKSDYGTSYRRCGVLQRQSRLKISFCEIFGVGRFPTFATISAKRRHARASAPNSARASLGVRSGDAPTPCCRCSMQLCLIKLDKRAAEAAPILGIPVEPI
jgi:hypothetical protein